MKAFLLFISLALFACQKSGDFLSNKTEIEIRTLFPKEVKREKITSVLGDPDSHFISGGEEVVRYQTSNDKFEHVIFFFREKDDKLLKIWFKIR